MKKYWPVAKYTWDEVFTYRLNFVMWRIRNVFQLLTVYFIWNSLIPQNATLLGYSRSLMLTYILGTSFITAILFSSRTQEIGEQINSGDLSNFLLKPMNYYFYFAFKDIGDKSMNIFFSVVELLILFLILQPPLFFQTNIVYILFTIMMLMLAMVMFF